MTFSMLTCSIQHTLSSYNCIGIFYVSFYLIVNNPTTRSHHAIQGRKSRQQSLKFQYKFICTCEACVNDWPTYLVMKPSHNLPLNIIKRTKTLLNSEAIENLQKGNKDTALQLFKPLCELIEELESYAPCMELSDCQESLKQCLTIFEGLLPYGYSNIVQWIAIPSDVD